MYFNMYLSAATFLCGMAFFVSGAPVCKIPADLNIHYEKLIAATLGNKFLLPAEYISHSDNKPSIRGETTCPTSLPNSGEMQDRSTCPWYTNITTDTTLFPSMRSEAVCRCQECIGSNGKHICEIVYSEMMFLKRTSNCVDGLYVYEPITKHISTGCVCARKKTGNSDYDYDI